ncbi:unnamed protein product [Pieris brassicae]|uniref:Uncharacterized protein n=1 Tax=Pieris brassicae TaxID=7116 RepID=A0A9P0XBU2_PIEBR|nr:unnamed protein product [Pieris brassicae]
MARAGEAALTLGEPPDEPLTSLAVDAESTADSMLRDVYTRITHPSRAVFRATINKNPERNEGAAACARPPRLSRAIGRPPDSLRRDWPPQPRRCLRPFFRCIASARRNVPVSFGWRVERSRRGCIDKNVTGNQYEPGCRGSANEPLQHIFLY